MVLWVFYSLNCIALGHVDSEIQFVLVTCIVVSLNSPYSC